MSLPVGVIEGANGQLWDFREHTAKPYKERFFDKASRRRFQRLQTGLAIGENKRTPMRFLTLTTAKGVKRDICKDFDILKKRIFRLYGWKFNKYFKLKTREGPEKQVLHIVFWGRFIPLEWLRKVWTEIHQSPVVDIRALRSGRKSMAGISYYLITNYFSGQPVERMSCGWKWAWLGVCKSWKNVIATYGCMRFTDPKEWKNNIVPQFHTRFKFAHVMARWKNLMLEPLPTTRQTKWCNPDHTKYNKKFI